MSVTLSIKFYLMFFLYFFCSESLKPYKYKFYYVELSKFVLWSDMIRLYPSDGTRALFPIHLPTKGVIMYVCISNLYLIIYITFILEKICNQYIYNKLLLPDTKNIIRISRNPLKKNKTKETIDKLIFMI